jgi:hypothetical protein
MSIITVDQVTSLLEAVEDFDITVWTTEGGVAGDKILTLADNFAQPYLEDVLCNGKTFDYVTYTEKLDGNGLCNLTLPHRPVVEAVSVTIDGDEVVPISEIFVYPSKIARNTIFPIGRQNIEVVYKAGYSAAPPSISLAVAMLCACHISRVCGSGGDSVLSAITAGPISLREAFSPNGKYAAKIADWTRMVSRITRKYGGTKLISGIRKMPESGRYYDPRTDSYVDKG